MGPQKLSGTETQFVHDTWTEVLDNDIRPSAQFARCIPVPVTREVEIDTSFAAVEVSVRQPRQPGACRRVDMHDIGTVLRQELGGERARDVLAEIDDANAVEGTRHAFSSRTNIE
jgi:hypothetical protein